MADVSFDNAFALLVGVGGLNFDITVKDATDIHQILTDPLRAGYPDNNVKLLTEEGATRDAFIKELDQLVENTSKAKDATVFIFYSGHGGQYQSQAANDSDGFEYYLKTWGHQENDPENTMLNGKIFSEKIAQIKAKRLIILLDCCHAAGIKETGGIVKKGNDTISDKMILSGTKLIEQLQGGKGRVFISACADNETSVILPRAKNSLFTQVTLEALEGAASGEDALVRVIDLMYHVLREVPARIKKYNHPQNPVINEVTDLNPTYYLCQNARFLKDTPPGKGPVIKNIDSNREIIDLKSEEMKEKMNFILDYKVVVNVQVGNIYNQKIENHGNNKSTTTIGTVNGDINFNNGKL